MLFIYKNYKFIISFFVSPISTFQHKIWSRLANFKIENLRIQKNSLCGTALDLHYNTRILAGDHLASLFPLACTFQIFIPFNPTSFVVLTQFFISNLFHILMFYRIKMMYALILQLDSIRRLGTHMTCKKVRVKVGLSVCNPT